jgi:hypothetical protein
MQIEFRAEMLTAPDTLRHEISARETNVPRFDIWSFRESTTLFFERPS